MRVLQDVEIRACGADDLEAFGRTLSGAFGNEVTESWLSRLRQLIEPERLLCALDGGSMVGTAGAYSFGLSVPGGVVAAAGVTLVGVLPSHRRRGILTRMMQRQLSDIRAHGEPVAILWASEGNIYHRFGYGMATIDARIDIDRDRAVFRDQLEPQGRTRLVSLEEAATLLPDVYDRVRASTPGMVTRSKAWWTARRLRDEKEDRRGGGPLFSAVWEVASQPDGYALYRAHSSWEDQTPAGWLNVMEAVAASPVATREIWRYLFGVDLIRRVKAGSLPVDNPLQFLVAEPRRLRMALSDGLWLRILDVQPALAARRYRTEGAVIFDLRDAFCPWNAGRWRLETHPGTRATVERTSGAPDLTLEIQDLAAAYLGGVAFTQLVLAGRVQEERSDAALRADNLFRTDRAPWCAEVF